MMLTKKGQQKIHHKLKILNEAEQCKNVSFVCRRFGISRDTFYRWKKQYIDLGEKGLLSSKPCPQNPKIRVKPEIEEKILHLRKYYHFGPQKISWYIERYNGLKVSETGVRGVLLRYKLNRLPKNERKRNIKSFRRYEKQVPGHHVQVDVKFLFF